MELSWGTGNGRKSGPPQPSRTRIVLGAAALAPGAAALALATFMFGAALDGVGAAPAPAWLAALSLPVLAWLLWLLWVRAAQLHRVLTVGGQLGPVWHRTLAAREGERHRLQRDLHDGVGPVLAGLRLRLDTAAAELAHQPDARLLVVDAATQAARVMDEVRRIIDDLRPLDLESVGLTDGVRRLAKRLDGGQATVVLDLPAVAPVMSPGAEIAAYRIVSECLTNALRHSGARVITVRMVAENDQLVLEVADDGTGLVPAGSGPGTAGAGPGPVSGGTGLASIAQRAEEIGGCCAVLSAPGTATGTVVRTLLPRFLR